MSESRSAVTATEQLTNRFCRISLDDLDKDDDGYVKYDEFKRYLETFDEKNISPPEECRVCRRVPSEGSGQ